jgi:hypothetical protein|tara:strand:- start:6816 stop:7010 length:195 start_codon:yes stop_codon:yes gene_type:complete
MVSEEKFMLEFLQWIIGWIQVIPWLVMGASLVAALTPTPVDDGLVKKAYKVLDWVALNVGKAKD